MNKTGKLNECLVCKFGTYNKNKFHAARLTGNTFEFICPQEKAQDQFDEDSFVTTEEMKNWTNSCEYFEPRPES